MSSRERESKQGTNKSPPLLHQYAKMLIFFDETFRESLRHEDVSLGALCGIGIHENELGQVESDVFKLKYKHMGSDYARNQEIKGKDLLKNYVFKLEARGITSKNLALAKDLIEYIVSK